jgi:hypothetical protein
MTASSARVSNSLASSIVVAQPQRVAEAKEVLFELGCEALVENADWVVQHRHRPPTLPGGKTFDETDFAHVVVIAERQPACGSQPGAIVVPCA